ncbi:MAG: serpin family protein [Lachnospiraceae bacterium]|nr:serpin family protein [Ruminococcus sp.]MCM1274772.1 serpin family protein [Lachnospiraceae bacterium]
MKKKMTAALAALLTLASASGCSSDSGESGGMTVGKVEMANLAPIEVTEDNVRNSVRLFDAVSAGKANAMFSPLSLNMALGMLAEGAEGETRAALDGYLGGDGYGAFAESYMKHAEESLNEPSSLGSKYDNVFEIANSFWADEEIPFKESYKSVLQQRFGAEVRNIDFSEKSKALKAINGWVNEKTHKMIPSIISDYDEELLKAVLVNTVYFESAWRDEWAINENNMQTFTLLDGSTKELPLMRRGVSSYFENDKATAFSCGYRNGLEFIGILPKETGDFTIESLDIPSLLESESYDYDVYARMPRLKFDSEFDLTKALAAAGLGEIFDPDSADLSGMSEFPLYVSAVLQKTSLELDENGTKAAAVTAVLMGAGGMPEEREEKYVYLDRPFAFMIYDYVQGQIVFLGKVTEP